jgi:3-dehydroquinate dehydratase II
MKLLIIHGPNLNLLGKREPGIYGSLTLAQINDMIHSKAAEIGLQADIMQSNSEAEIIETIHNGDFDLLIINPAAYTHTSIAIRDAIVAVGKPAIEVHISNIHGREEFRRRSFIAEVAIGQITGFGAESYFLAILAAKTLLSKEQSHS